MAIPQHQFQQQQSKPFRNLLSTGDAPIPAPIAFFGHPSFPDQSQPQFNSPFHVVGLAPSPVTALDGAGVDPQWTACEQQLPKSKRLREQEFLENSQISSVDFLQTRSVSTGLGLSLDDRRMAAASSSGDSPVLSLFDEDIDRELQRQDAEMDRFVKVQGERLRQTILKKVQDNQLQTVSSVEERILQKLREKEAEVVDMNRRNMELEERMKQLSAEAGQWQLRVKCNENKINTLKYNLQQVFAQNKDSKEGCGDSEVDDTASCSNGPVDFNFVSKENKDLKDLMNCKVCRVNEVCRLLLPCRHLCLCKECESKLSFCPLCQSLKFIGMQVYL